MFGFLKRRRERKEERRRIRDEQRRKFLQRLEKETRLSHLGPIIPRQIAAWTSSENPTTFHSPYNGFESMFQTDLSLSDSSGSSSYCDSQGSWSDSGSNAACGESDSSPKSFD